MVVFVDGEDVAIPKKHVTKINNWIDLMSECVGKRVVDVVICGSGVWLYTEDCGKVKVGDMFKRHKS